MNNSNETKTDFPGIVKKESTLRESSSGILEDGPQPKIDHHSKIAKLSKVSVMLEDLFPSHLRKLGKMHSNAPSCSCIYCRGEYTYSNDSELFSKNRQNEKQPTQVQNSGLVLKSDQSGQRKFNPKSRLKLEGGKTLSRSEKSSLKCEDGKASNAHLKVQKLRKTYKCKLCAKRFPLMSSLLSHGKEHNADKLFKCKQCPAKFWFESFLDSHLRVHSKKRPFKDNPSSAKFTHEGEVHVRKYGRPIKCPHCPADFRFKANLKFHLKKHSSENAKSLEESRKSPQEFNSESEQNVESTEMSFQCEECSNNSRSCLACFLTKKSLTLVNHSEPSSDPQNFGSSSCYGPT